MLRAQIPVPLTDPALDRTRLERRRMRSDERVGEALERLDSLDLAALFHIAEQLVEVALEPALRREHRRAIRRDPSCAGVELGQDAPHLSHLLSPQLPAFESGRGRVPFVVAAHLDHEVDRAGIVFSDQTRTVVG